MFGPRSQSSRRALALAVVALASIAALGVGMSTPARAQDPLDDIQLRPRTTKPDTVTAAPAPAAPAAVPATTTAPAPGPDTAAPPQATPAEEPPEAVTPAPSASKARPQRVVNLEQVEVNASDYVLEPDPIGGSVVLNLGKIEREPERKWSLQLSFGTGEASLDESISRVRTMEQLGRDIFGQLADQQSFDLGWSDESTSEPTTAFRIRGDVRYKPVRLLTLEAELGRAAVQSAFSQPGYRFDESSEIIDASIGGLVTLPWRLWRFGFYAGGGFGILRGTLTSQLFVPSFTGTPDFSVSRATGSSQQYNLKGGGEVYITRFVSFTLEAEYRKAEIDELEYDDDAEIKAINETNVPLAWLDYDASFLEQRFFPIGDPSQPVKIDFTGVMLTGGLRYHF